MNTAAWRMMNNGKTESNEANAETEDPDEECKYGPAKLAGIERDRRGIGRSKPRLRTNQEDSKMNTGYTVKNPGRGTGYRLPLNNDKIRLQKTSYGDAIYGELTDTIGKMETIMKLENWKTMLDTVPVEEWPVYIEKSRSADN